MTNFLLQIDSAGMDKFLISDRSSLKPKKLEFVREDTDLPILSIKDINVALLDKEYTTSGVVISIDESETTSFRDMKCQKVHLAHEKDVCCLMLWGKLVGSMDLNSSYTVKSVKVRLDGERKYLTTTPNTEVEPIPDVEIDIEHISFLTTTTNEAAVGRFISIRDCFFYRTCPTCFRAIHEEGQVITCSHCSGTTLDSLCEEDGNVILHFQNSESKENVQLTLYKAILDDMLNTTPCEHTSSALLKDKTKATIFLLGLKSVKVKYDSARKVVACEIVRV